MSGVDPGNFVCLTIIGVAFVLLNLLSGGRLFIEVFAGIASIFNSIAEFLKPKNKD
jgi:hypothetical protein